MKLGKFAKWAVPGFAFWTMWRYSRAKLTTQREPQNRIEIKFLSKNEFLNSMVNSQQSPALVIVFGTSHLRKAEGQERERKIIQLSKDIAISLKDLPGVNVYLFRHEDFKVLEKGIESTSQKELPFKIDKDKEVYLFFKRPDYKGYFDMNEEAQHFTIEAISNKNYFKSLKTIMERLSQPVATISSLKQLKAELVRNVGINDRPIVVDVCKKQDLEKEREKLTQYMLSRFDEKLISPFSRGLVVNSAILEDHGKSDIIGVIKNDFKVLERLHSVCKTSQEFASDNPEFSAQFYSNATYDLLLASLAQPIGNFESSTDEKKIEAGLDDLIQPDIPLFLSDNTVQNNKFYSHIFRNQGKKILSLNLLKEDFQTADYIEAFSKVSSSKALSDSIGFQVFAESSHERMLKHLNKYYSPFCLYDLTSSVGKSYQKLFVSFPFMCSYPAFEASLQAAIARSRDLAQSDRVMYSEDSIESVSSRAFEFYQRKHKAKVRLLLLQKPGDKCNLLYERHFLEKFGLKDYIKLGRMEWPNSLGPNIMPPNYPSLLITTPHGEKPLLLDLPSSFRSAENQQRFIALLDDNVSSTFAY
jgi:hypothetical protein